MLSLRACTAVPGRILRPAPPPPAHADRRRDHREDDVRRKKPNTLSPLALTTDANYHQHDRHDRPVSPLSPSSYARRKLGHIEDISKHSLQTDRVANITVSPPTPGTYRYVQGYIMPYVSRNVSSVQRWFYEDGR